MSIKSLLLGMFIFSLGIVAGWLTYPLVYFSVEASRDGGDQSKPQKSNERVTGQSTLAAGRVNDDSLSSTIFEFQNFSSWNEWYEKFQAMSLTRGRYYALLAGAQIYFKQNYIDALESMSLAIDLADSFEDVLSSKAQREKLIKKAIDVYFSENNTMEQGYFKQFLDVAIEKQPDLIDIHLGISKFYETQNELERALDALEYVAGNPSFEKGLLQPIARLKTLIANRDNVDLGIPLQKKGDQYLVDVTINNEYPLKLLIDTGASQTALSHEVIEKLSNDFSFVKQPVMARVNTANGEFISSVYQANSMNVRGFYYENIQIYSIELNSQDIDGLLGMDFLSTFRFRIDHEQEKLFLRYDTQN